MQGQKNKQEQWYGKTIGIEEKQFSESEHFFFLCNKFKKEGKRNDRAGQLFNYYDID